MEVGTGAAPPCRACGERHPEPAEILYESDRTRISRCPVAGRPSGIVRKQALGAGARARTAREAAVLSRLVEVPGVVRLAGPAPGPADTRLLLEDVRGLPLAHVLQTERPVGAAAVALALQVGGDLLQVLERVHRQGVVHRDVNPSNLLVFGPDHQVQLIDFGLASVLSLHCPDFTQVGEIAGTLPYLAPEQTGRMGRAQDHRADLYAAGATLYEMATGGTPFADVGEPARLIHDHLTRVPASPDRLNPEVPPALARIIMRLLEKEPDLRYQSALGAAHDLARVADGWARREVEPFPLGERDFPHQLVAPSRPIGRDRESAALVAAFHGAVSTGTELVLLTGEQGTGKTALVGQLRETVATAGGWFVTGEFDAQRQELAADGVYRALRGLGRLLLAEPDHVLGSLRIKLREALAHNAELMSTLVPELGPLLGFDSPPAGRHADGEPDVVATRVAAASVDLLRAVVSAERPLVLVLENLQWAASTPLRIVDAVVTAPRIPGLLVVGTYRDTMIGDGHPLTSLPSRWEGLGRVPRRVNLTDLGPQETAQMVGDVLRLPPERARQLAEPAWARTAGNPVDTLELLNALRHEGVLRLGAEGWSWDTAAASSFIGHGDVRDMLATRLAQLPRPTDDVVQTMACMGGEVDLGQLLDACALSVDQLRDRLTPALQEGLIVPTGRHEGVKFRHDRVRQAVHDRMTPQERLRRHLAIARRLAPLPERAMAAAEQYLAASPLLDDAADGLRAATLMSEAGTALEVVNLEMAQRYLAGAVPLLLGRGSEEAGADGEDGEDGEPAARLASIRIVLHRLACRQHRFADADLLFAEIVAHQLDPLVRADPVGAQIAGLCARFQLRDAIQLGSDTLHELGVAIPASAQTRIAEVERGLADLAGWVGPASLAADLARPETADPRVRAVARLVARMSMATYLGDRSLHDWLFVLTWRMWVEHGPCQELLGPLRGFSTVLAGSGDHRLIHAVGCQLLTVGEARGYEPGTAQLRMGFVVGACHWGDPVEEAIVHAHRAARVLDQYGDPETAGFCTASVATQPQFDCTATLEEYLGHAEQAKESLARAGHPAGVSGIIPSLKLALALQGFTRTPDGLPDGTDDDGQGNAERPRNGTAVALTTTFRALAAAILDQPAEVIAYARRPSVEGAVMPTSYLVSTIHLLRALGDAHLLRGADGDRDPRVLADLDQHRDWLAERARDAPANYGHLAAWVTAERAWALGDPVTAMAEFDRALGLVRQQQRPWHQALITERFGQLHTEQQNLQVGELLLVQAHRCYVDWGATAKGEQLQARHPFLAGPSPVHGTMTVAPAAVTSRSVHPGSGTTGDGRALTSATVDLHAVLEAALALASETGLDRLWWRVSEVLGTLTGASSVRLLLWNEDAREWSLPVAHGDRGRQPANPGDDNHPGGDNHPIGNDHPAGGFDDAGDDAPSTFSLAEAVAQGLVPLSAFRYAERTREPLLVHDAVRDERFAADPYLRGLEHCSLLVVPITSQGRLRAMLVLDNRLSGGVFTADRLDAVVLVAGQLAVSLDNALAARFRTLVRRSSDLTLVCDRQGRLTYANTAALDTLGRPGDEVVGSLLLEHIHPDDRATVGERLSGLDEQAEKVWEIRILTEDGQTRWAQGSLTDLRGDPAVAGLVLHLRDVTERRRLEDELRHAQKLESVGQLAAGIAHELNTPIQFVKDNLAYLSDAYANLTQVIRAYQAAAESADPAAAVLAATALATELDVPYLVEDIPDALTQSLDGADRVATIVRAMKSFGYHSNDAKAPADLNEAIRNTLVVAANEIKYVADVVTDLADLPPVTCNLGDINQAVLNLLVNAAHAIAETETVTAGGRGVITVRSRPDGDSVVIDIQDTGTGIPPEIANRVFDQFFTTKPVGKGTGQGLTLTHTLIHHRHGGSVTFESTPGAGTTFTIRLPVHGVRDGGSVTSPGT